MEKRKQSKKAQVKTTIAKEVIKDVETVKEVKTEMTKSKDHSLFKAVLITLLVGIVLSWIIPSGTFAEAEFTKGVLVRTGINEAFLSVFYGANYYLVQIIALLVIGVFYGVISKMPGYSKMVAKVADFFKGREKLFVLLNSLIIALMTSLLSQPFIALLFIPMLYSVAKRLNISKLTTILMTFGSMMIGLMGPLYSSYGMDYINSYMNTTYKDGIIIRLAILMIGYLLINVFAIYADKKARNAKEVEEIFATTIVKDGKSWPYFVIFALVFVLSILGYFNWAGVFNFTKFSDFHTWLTTKVVVGEHPIFGYLIGNVTAFGTWDILTISYILLLILVFVKLFSGIKWNEVFDHAYLGVVKMLKPAILVMFAYALFVICYWSGMTNTITNFFNSTEKFNPYLNAIGNLITNSMHVDFGYSGFAFAGFFAAKWSEFTTQILTIMTSMNGLGAFVAPTSIYMLIGLSLSDMSYTKWIKSIWKFVVLMLVVLFVIFTVITYL